MIYTYRDLGLKAVPLKITKAKGETPLKTEVQCNIKTLLYKIQFDMHLLLFSPFLSFKPKPNLYHLLFPLLIS